MEQTMQPIWSTDRGVRKSTSKPQMPDGAIDAAANKGGAA
jgi:hypothetical protein